MLIYVITFDASSEMSSDPCESQPHKGHLTSMTVSIVPSLDHSLNLLFIFFIPRCTLPDFSSLSSLVSLSFLSCHRTTTNVGAEYRSKNALYFYRLPWLKLSKFIAKKISAIDCLIVVWNVRIRTYELPVLKMFVVDWRTVC